MLQNMDKWYLILLEFVATFKGYYPLGFSYVPGLQKLISIKKKENCRSNNVTCSRRLIFCYFLSRHRIYKTKVLERKICIFSEILFFCLLNFS